MLPREVVITVDNYRVITAPQPDAHAHRFTTLAGAVLSGHRAVITGADGRAVYADNLTSEHAGLLAGITLGAALENASVTVQALGLLTESSWNWTPGPLWLGENGVITQARPVAGLLWRLGVALSATTILWRPDLPIQQ